MEIVLGIDFDADAKQTFTLNFPNSAFLYNDVREVALDDIRPFTERRSGDKLVFCGCAPCQPFSKVKTKPQSPGEAAPKVRDDRIDLLTEFGRFVQEFVPDYVLVENVPGLQKPSDDDGPFAAFVGMLGRLEYASKFEVISCHHFGVPQTRQRLVLIASKDGQVPWPAKTHGPGTENPNYRTVWDEIGWLPKLEAGQADPSVANHRCAALSPINLQRIKAVKPGKGRECWPDELKLSCHKEHCGHSDVYGRLRRDRPAAALTTRCISLSNGRFGHPAQDRAISVREAACLQTFDRAFEFRGSLNSMARQIGNAVPVALAKAIGTAIIEHVKSGASV